MNFLHIISARHIGGYRLALEFSDGSSGEADLAEELDGSVFEPLRDNDFFKQFEIKGSTVEWPNGADFAPEFLHQLACKHEAVLA